MLKPKANLVFGMMEDVPYQEQRLMLEKGDVIYLYTDGVTEALNAENELFGEERLADALNAHSESLDASDAFIQHIYEQVDAFANGVSQADDITMVCLSRK